MSWPTLPLRRQFRLVNGGTPTADTPNWDGDVPWATPVDLARVNGGVLTSTDRTLSEEGLATGSRAVPPGSLVLSTRAPIGYVAETMLRMAFNQGCRGLVPRGPMSVRYFRYQLQSIADQLAALGQGSTFVELSSDSLASVPLVVPPAATQRAVADYLDRETLRIDTLIAAKRRMVELLEERFARQTSALLLGPKAYLPVRLKFICGPPTSGNRDHGSFTYTSDGIPCLRGIDLSKDYVDLSTVLRISAEDSQRHANTKLHVGDLVIVRSGATAGRSALVTRDLGGSNCVDLVVVRKSPALEPRYLAYVVRSREIQDRVLHESSGALQPHFNAVDAGEILVPMRSLDDQKWIVTTLDDLALSKERMVDALDRQTDLLQERRQALITAAVTGQLDIPEAA